MENANMEVLENQGMVTILGRVNKDSNIKENVVNGRDLHKVLNIGKKFTTWFNDKIEKYGFEEGVDFFPVLGENNSGGRGRPTKDYYVKLDTAKEIAMVENNEEGRAVRKYFIEAEKRLQEQNNQIPSTLESLQVMINNMVEQKNRMDKFEEEQQNQKDKVTNMEYYLSETPDRKKIDREIKSFARKTGYTEAEARSYIYKIVEDKYGISVKTRVKNERKRINKQREKEGKPPYKATTLVQKYNGMDLLSDLGMLRETLEVIAGVQ